MKIEDLKKNLNSIINNEFDFSQITEDKIREISNTANYLFELNNALKQLNEFTILTNNNKEIINALNLTGKDNGAN